MTIATGHKCAECDLTGAFDGLKGIDSEIQQHLLH
jgi:hypothetical protein